MDKSNKMLIDSTHPEETRVVVLKNGRVEEFDFESAARKLLRGNIYLAKVTRVEPSLQAAFVEYGGNRHGFLAFNEIHPDYYQIPVADREALKEEEAAIEAEEEARADARAEARANRDRGGRGRGERRDAGDGDNGDTRNASHDHDRDDGPHDHDDLDIAHQPVESGAEAAHDHQHHDRGYEHAHDHHPHGEHTHSAIPLAGDDRDQTITEPAPHGHAAAEGDLDHGDNGHIEEVAEIGEAPEVVNPSELDEVGSEDAMEEVPERPRRQRRRQYKIQEVIRRRQIILIQVVKEERGNKGAALTTYLSLAGRYTVLMPNTGRGGGISRKITQSQDRKRLKAIAQELEVPEGMGLIVRTAGASRTKQEIKRDFEYLMRLWESVRDLTLESTAPSLVYEEGNLIKRSIRDLYSKDVEEIVVAGEPAYSEASGFMGMLMPSHTRNVVKYDHPDPLFARYRIEQQLNAMFSPHVTLKSGGYLVINQTEALVAIDVNSGKSTREFSIEETALNTNLEASEEIARQLKLRDLAGLIVIDFIDMEERRNNRKVENRLKDALRHDRARIQVGRISHFGLMEMSRQRLRTGVLEGSTSQCPHCQGTGIIRSTESVALAVLRGIEDHLMRDSRSSVTAATTAQVALYILNNKRAYITEMESRFGVSIAVQSSERMQGANFSIEKSAAPLQPKKAPQRAAVSMDWGFEGEDQEPVDTVDDLADDAGERDVEHLDHENDRDGDSRARDERGEEGRSDEQSGRRGRRRRRRGRGRNGETGTTDRNGGAERVAGNRPRGDDDDERPSGEHDRDEDGVPRHEFVTSEGDDVEPNGREAGEHGEPRDAPEQGDAEKRGRRRRRGRRGGRRRDREGGQPQFGEGAPGDQPSGEAYAADDRDIETGASDDGRTDTAGHAHAGAEPRESARSELARDDHRGRRERPAVARDDELGSHHAPQAVEPRDREPEPAPRPIQRAALHVAEPAPAAPEPPPPAEEPARPARKGWWQRRMLGE